MKNKSLLLVGLLASVLFVIAAIAGCQQASIPKKINDINALPSKTIIQPKGASTGWSTNPDPAQGVKEAVEMAKNGLIGQPKYAIFYTTNYNPAAALSEIKTMLPGVKLHGATSKLGIFSEKGYHYNPNGTIGIMLVSSDDVAFGVGSANYEGFASVQEAAISAMREAMSSAGKTGKPDIVLISSSLPYEEEALAAIETVIGKDVPVIGGSAARAETPIVPDWALYAEKATFKNGIMLTAVYTNLSVGWVFKGGFDRTEKSGAITKADGRTIFEIDNRPAVDVLDEWLGGEIRKGMREGLNMNLFTGLHPLYKILAAPDGSVYQLYIHEWPASNDETTTKLSTAARVEAGQRVYLSYGAWQTLLNRIGKLPHDAKVQGNMLDKNPSFGFSVICGSVGSNIPLNERGKMSILANEELGANVPYIGTFTSGEDGQFPGIGNRHGNVLTSFVLIGGG
jgi:hypothetical protein